MPFMFYLFLRFISGPATRRRSIIGFPVRPGTAGQKKQGSENQGSLDRAVMEFELIVESWSWRDRVTELPLRAWNSASSGKD
jgi:hypothetical protein